MTESDPRVAEQDPAFGPYQAAMARLMTEALVRYTELLRWLNYFFDHPEDRAPLVEFDRCGREIGAELIGYVRVIELTRDRWDQGDYELIVPALEFARLLGETYTVFLLARDKESAEGIPIVPVEALDEAFTPEVRAWLSRWVDEVPHLEPLTG